MILAAASHLPDITWPQAIVAVAFFALIGWLAYVLLTWER